MRLRITVLLAVLACAIIACGPGPLKPFRLIAGSGFSSYEPMLKEFAQQNGVQLSITYKGSLDIMRLLEAGNFDYDAIWEADSLWTSIGDKQKALRDQRSIACSPVVFSVKKNIAQDLGWIGKTDVRMRDILAALQARKLRTLMTSATQSNSGASAYFGFLYAFAANPDVLTSEHLQDRRVREDVRRVLSSIDRTSESSGWLRDLFIKEYDNYDAMFNYESHVIAVNQAVTTTNHEPLYIVYPVEGLGIADFPMSFVSRNNADKKPIFDKMQQFLLSKAGQDQIAKFGRRVGPLCNELDPSVNRSDWGVDTTRTINTFRYPAEPVIWEALNAYQTVLRRPSFTIYALDFSGSMAGKGEQQLKQAMRILLDQGEAAKYLLQASPDDITMVIVFNHAIVNAAEITDGWTVSGNDPAAMASLLARIDRQGTGGNTNIWSPTARALELFKQRGIGERIPAVILMTDGQSNQGSIDDVRRAIAATGLNVPTYNITFGDASVDQLKTLAELTKGRIFDGTKDLITAFRNAKGNN